MKRPKLMKRPKFTEPPKLLKSPKELEATEVDEVTEVDGATEVDEAAGVTRVTKAIEATGYRWQSNQRKPGKTRFQWIRQHGCSKARGGCTGLLLSFIPPRFSISFELKVQPEEVEVTEGKFGTGGAAAFAFVSGFHPLNSGINQRNLDTTATGSPNIPRSHGFHRPSRP